MRLVALQADVKMSLYVAGHLLLNVSHDALKHEGLKNTEVLARHFKITVKVIFSKNGDLYRPLYVSRLQCQSPCTEINIRQYYLIKLYTLKRIGSDMIFAETL